MRHRRSGFTLIEIVTVLIVGVILTSIAIRSLGGVEGKFAVRQARSTFAALHARARAQAIETGGLTELWVDAATDSVWIDRSGTRLETIRFAEEFGVDIQLATATLRLCMNARGFAEASCNSFTTTQTITFAARGDTASLQMRTLGQIRY